MLTDHQNKNLPDDCYANAVLIKCIIVVAKQSLKVKRKTHIQGSYHKKKNGENLRNYLYYEVQRIKDNCITNLWVQLVETDHKDKEE